MSVIRLKGISNVRQPIDATLSGLGALFEITQGSREDAATLGWMMEYLRHSLKANAKSA